MLRSGSPHLVAQELAAWAAGTEMTRGVARDGYRTIADRNRHRSRKSKSPGSLGHATAKDTATRIAPAIITMASTPA